jgi:hypothetical protein
MKERGIAMSALDGSGAPAFSLGSMLVRLLPSLVYSAIIPIAIYLLAIHLLHLGTIPALLVASLSPLVGTIIDLVRQRRVSVLGVFGFAGIVAKVLSALLFHNPRLVLIGDSMLGGVLGLLLLGSVLIGQPLIVALAVSMPATSPEERRKMKERLMAQALHRHLQILTAIWGIGLLLELAASVVFTFTLPLTAAVVVRTIMSRLVIVGLLALTAGYRWYVMRGRALGGGPADTTDAS